MNKYILSFTTLDTGSSIIGRMQVKKESKNCWKQGLLLVQKEVLVWEKKFLPSDFSSLKTTVND